MAGLLLHHCHVATCRSHSATPTVQAGSACRSESTVGRSSSFQVRPWSLCVQPCTPAQCARPSLPRRSTASRSTCAATTSLPGRPSASRARSACAPQCRSLWRKLPEQMRTTCRRTTSSKSDPLWCVRVCNGVTRRSSQGAGLHLKPLQGIYQYPTIIMFASGAGIATARALIEGGEGPGGLCFPRRQAVVLYYSVRWYRLWCQQCVSCACAPLDTNNAQVPNASSVAFGEHGERWQELGVRVVTSTRDTFQVGVKQSPLQSIRPMSRTCLTLMTRWCMSRVRLQRWC